MKTDEFTEFPPFMPTWLAARYCGFHTPQGLHAAFHKALAREGRVSRSGRPFLAAQIVRMLARRA